MRTQKEIRQRAPLWLIGLLILNLGLMSYDARDQLTKQRMIRVWTQAAASAFQRPVTSVGGAGAGFFQRIGSIRNAVSENEELRRRLAEVETQVREAQTARDENERLRSLLGLKEESPYQIVPARVIARDPSIWFNSVIINRGTSSGIEKNMPVVTQSGIVGRVVAVSPWTSQVMLLTDEKSAAGSVVGQLGNSNALGVVRGVGEEGLLEMRYVSGLETVNVGDYVVTTGQDGIYPPGLGVGTVVDIKQGSATMPHTIRVKPGARIDSLEEVAVLQYHPPQRTVAMSDKAPDKAQPNVDKERSKQ
ncbi:MAG TPA: rod shape-determining protein MreC [Pyrinomonadaceae bacterium]